MKDYQRQFIDFAISINALRFGEFTLKSGRLSPYFFNSGCFDTGASLARLGEYYAQAIVDSGIEFTGLYGPAYKGIPLVAAVAIALARKYRMDVPYTFNRKEAKDHGEGGLLVGAALKGRILVIDDVISAGTSVRESVEIIRGHQAVPVGVAISVDRQERGQGELSAIQEVEADYRLQVIPIIRLEHLLDYLVSADDQDPQLLQRINAYRERYGQCFRD